MKNKIILISIFLLTLFFRFQNINWDQGYHLHPDERFLTMVGGVMKLPTSISTYLDPATSTFNPANIGYPFFVYGVFPVTFNKIIAILFQNDTYGQFTLQGRVLSGLFDIFTLFFIYKTCILLERKKRINSKIKYWASFLYAISVLPIQLSHFFATDTFLNTFVFITFYYSLSFFYSKKNKDLLLSAFFFGLAIGSKINAVYILPLSLLFLCSPFIHKKKVFSLVTSLFIFFCVSYLTLRIVNPYYFESDNIFLFQPSLLFLKNINELTAMSSGSVFFPPAVQWYSKVPVFFALFNLAMFGLGPFCFIFSIIGMISIAMQKIRERKELLLIGLWVISYFIYYSIQFAKTMRYFILIYPFLCIFAAFGINKCILFFMHYKKNLASNRKVLIVNLIIILCLLAWPLLFSSIYFYKHTRFQASEWIYKNLPDKSIILSEYWDDALPLPIGINNKTFTIELLTVFDQDTKEKWNKINQQLKYADYYILSSNRGWGSIPTIAKKYPQMSQFYIHLFDGKTSYKLLNKFIPSYQFFFPFHPASWFNNWFDESFTVYDHPSVFIFQNMHK